MEKVLDLIEARKQEFAECQLIRWMRDERVTPLERLGFTPAMLPYIMGFRDVLRHLEVAAPRTDVDRLVNTHVREDGGHWVWYLQDLEKLGYRQSSWGGTVEDSYAKLWHDATNANFDTVYVIVHYARLAQEHPALRVVLLEAIEATFEAFIGPARAVTIQAGLDQELAFFGEIHAGAEEAHELHGVDLQALRLDDATRELAMRAVEDVFAAYTRMLDQWYENRAAFPRMAHAVPGVF